MKAFTIPAQFTGFSPTADRGVSLRFRSSREATGDEFKVLGETHQIEGTLVFAFNEISDEEIRNIKIEDRKGRTPSKELRAVLYRKWEQDVDIDARDGAPFETYYKRYIYTLIAQIKDELE